MMWWALCYAAALVCARASAAPPAAALWQLPAYDLQQIEPAPDDMESDSYVMANAADRSARDPWYFLLAEDPQAAKGVSVRGRSRLKRKMPSLSINNPMEVLRERLLLEVARKQMREAKQRQANANRIFLQNIG